TLVPALPRRLAEAQRIRFQERRPSGRHLPSTTRSAKRHRRSGRDVAFRKPSFSKTVRPVDDPADRLLLTDVTSTNRDDVQSGGAQQSSSPRSSPVSRQAFSSLKNSIGPPP